ncbi:MAG: disulfide bond formation protein DsbA [Betaproteobacteria bacterium]|nr:disulfide bond formation protein DsbA [Betaproteobacteria bacterium]
MELASSDADVEIVWRAFELRPDPAPTLDPDGEYLHRVWGSSVYPMAERLGMTIRLPPVQPRSRRAHEAAHWARGCGRFDEYNAAVFRAFFERGENIGEIGVLVKLAADLGLDEAALRASLETREFELAVIEDERLAQALGLSGVPAFVAGRKAALSGVQTVAGLRELIEHVRAA